MQDPQPFSLLSRGKTHRVRGPRPCSWISSSSDSLNDHRDKWPWAIQGSGLRRGSTLRSTTSSESEPSDSSTSSPSSSPVNMPKMLADDAENPCYRHARRRKPAGPRAPRNGSCCVMRPELRINTSLSVIPQHQRENSPSPPIQDDDVLPSPQIPPFAVGSPTNFLLDWEVIFKVLESSYG